MQRQLQSQKKQSGYAVCRYWLKTASNNVTPSWFSCVMGTGILATCLVLSPLDHPFFDSVGAVVWSFGALLLLALLILWLVRSIRQPFHLRALLHDSLHAQSWGTPPMACFTIASGFLLIGPQFLDPGMVILCAQLLWLSGVLGSIFSAVAVPYLLFTRYDVTTRHTYGNWLLPIAPLIGATVPGSLLTPYWPEPLHKEMLVLNYALWGTGVVLAAIIFVLVYSRLAYHKVPQGALVPTVWIVIGSAGQSATALLAMGRVANEHLADVGKILQGLGIAYSMLAWGFGIYWLLLAVLITLRAARIHLPFTISWWSFIYPIGVMTTGTYALHTHIPTTIFLVCGVSLLTLLIALWIVVTVKTIHHLRGIMHTQAHQHFTLPLLHSPQPQLESVPSDTL